MARQIGIRCDTVASDDVYYLVFYDVDRAPTEEDLKNINDLFTVFGISYICYQTKHGFHVVGLTPLDIKTHSLVFDALKAYFKSYYGGIVIRLSRKQGEEQILLAHNETLGYVIPNLWNLYCSRFGLEKKPFQKEFAKHRLVFEKYRTMKE